MENNEIDFKRENKYIKAIEKLFNTIPIKDRYVGDDEILNIMDPASIVLIHNKSSDGKEILKRFCSKHTPICKVPTIDYEKNGKSGYSSEYMRRIIEIFSIEDGFLLQSGEHMPLSIENNHFKIILAPRVTND